MLNRRYEDERSMKAPALLPWPPRVRGPSPAVSAQPFPADLPRSASGKAMPSHFHCAPQRGESQKPPHQNSRFRARRASLASGANRLAVGYRLDLIRWTDYDTSGMDLQVQNSSDASGGAYLPEQEQRRALSRSPGRSRAIAATHRGRDRSPDSRISHNTRSRARKPRH